MGALLLCCSSIRAQNTSGKIVFGSEPGRLTAINADGTGQTNLTAGGSILDDNPVYSPDGSKIAFHRQNGFRTDIWVMNADGSNPVAVLPGDTFNAQPSWSPDGNKLVFASNKSGPGKVEIWVANADGTDLVRLTTAIQVSADGQGPIFSSDIDPAWSPDGSRIAFSSSRDGIADRELYVMNADGTNQTRLTDNTIDDHRPTWSPDSQKIAFDANGGRGIVIINRDGTNPVNVTTDGFDPAWSPDGSRLAYLALDSANFFTSQIFIINTDGTNKFKVTNNDFGARAPSWAPASSPPIPSFTISGLVREANGTPISGASLTLLGAFIRNTQTDATGVYSFAGLAAGNYKILISKSGYGFNTTSVTLDNVTTNQTVNFTGFVAFSINVQVTPPVGSLPVTLTGTVNRSGVTDSGHVTFDFLPAGGNYTVSISSPFWTITPSSVTFNNLSANQTANFDAVLNKYTISGTITRLGAPKPGITVQLSDNTGFAPVTTTTDANGQYSFTDVKAGGPYTVRPVAANYVMQPQTRDFILDGNKTADFVANSANHILFSNVSFAVIEGTPSLQVHVNRGGNCCGVGPITVQYATADGTAKAGSDYSAVSGTLDFPEGTFSKTITIPIVDDKVREGLEDFSITLSNPTGEVDLGFITNSTLFITDNEPRILTETNSDRALAINATSFVAGPFTLTTFPNYSTDSRTRLSLFVEDLQFNQGFPAIVVEAVDAQQNRFQLPLEIVGVSSFFPFRQLIVRLPENLPAGELMIIVSANGGPSDPARITLKP